MGGASGERGGGRAPSNVPVKLEHLSGFFPALSP